MLPNAVDFHITIRRQRNNREFPRAMSSPPVIDRGLIGLSDAFSLKSATSKSVSEARKTLPL